jgi:hypothetical protein
MELPPLKNIEEDDVEDDEEDCEEVKTEAAIKRLN